MSTTQTPHEPLTEAPPPEVTRRTPAEAGFHVRAALTEGLQPLRTAIKERRKVRFGYLDKVQAKSARTVQPLGLFYRLRRTQPE